MRRWAATIAVVASAVLATCGGDETRVTNTSDNAEQTRELVVVSMVPPANAQEMTPGVFVLTMKRSDEAAPRIETAKSFMLQETIYDANGHEAGASVPSTTWSLLDESSRAQLAGMKVGEIRRVWTCIDTSTQRCKVEDVELLSVQHNSDPNVDIKAPMPVGAGVTAPVVVTRLEPKWPKQVTRQRTWLYSFVVTKAGHVRDLRLIQGESGVYSRLAEEALLQWTFKPGTYRGRPVDVHYNITITIHVR